jgi:hypothetical protein
LLQRSDGDFPVKQMRQLTRSARSTMPTYALLRLGVASIALSGCAPSRPPEMPAPCDLAQVQIDTSQRYRLGDAFLFGERATATLEGRQRDAPVAASCGRRQLRPGERVNALGGLEVNLQNSQAVIQHIRSRGYNVIISPELRRAGEVNWLRIEAPNRYYRRIQAASDPDSNAIRAQRLHLERADSGRGTTGGQSRPGTPGCRARYTESVADEGLVPRSGDATFSVSRNALEQNQWLREGSRVPVLYFYDLVQRFDCPYLRDLMAGAEQGRPVLSLSLQELPVLGADNAPILYRARSGDRIRFRLLVAEQDIRQRDRNFELLRAERLPDVPEYRLTTNLSWADDVEFTVAEYGLGLQIVPAVSYASATGDLNANQFNPIKKAPGITSAFYLRYEGRRGWLDVLQWIPGGFVSLLSLEGQDTKFTAGMAWSPPTFRRWVNLVYGWHDLKRPVVGLAISPSINFKTMLARDKPGR